MGKGSDGPTQTTSTVTQNSLPAYAEPYVLDVMQQAQALSQRPYEANPNPRIAPFSTDQTNAFDLGRDMGNVGSANLNQAQNLTGIASTMQGNAGYSASPINNPYATSSYSPSTFTNQNVTTGQWNNAAAAQYMDPYLTNVMDTTLARNEALFDRDQLARNSRAARSGAFGGLRQGVEDAVARSEFGRNTAEREAALMSQAYNTAFQGFTSDQGRGLQAALANQGTDLERQRLQEAGNQFGANFNDASQRAAADYALQFGQTNEQNRQQQAAISQQQAAGMADMARQFAGLSEQERSNMLQNIELLRTQGLDQQRQTQASLDLANEDFINQRDYDLSMLNFYNSIIRGMPVSANSNVVSYEQSNPYSQYLGLGLGAAGLWNALNPNTGGGGSGGGGG